MGPTMWGGLLWGAAHGLWAGQAVGAARGSLSYSSPPLEELVARGRPLWTFLQRQAVSESQLRFRRPDLVVVTKFLSEKEQELWETKHLLHDENEDLRKLAENEITLCQKEITQLKHQKKLMKVI
uniref:peptide chain release factor 1-like, mitochondrial n=1 Tax=Ictidomys tridecemlineatus TaxID=43179 RepID=UPI001A9DC75F|nr:peptide chain release factor 1-like, mitochondrial [Ictidomys tridecemlineatus]